MKSISRKQSEEYSVASGIKGILSEQKNTDSNNLKTNESLEKPLNGF